MADIPTPSWLSTWQAICEQETQAKIRQKQLLEDWYRAETKSKLMNLRVNAALRIRDEYIAHLFEKYPGWKPHFVSLSLAVFTTSMRRPAKQCLTIEPQHILLTLKPATVADYQAELYETMEQEMMRSWSAENNGLIRSSYSPYYGGYASAMLPTHYRNPFVNQLSLVSLAGVQQHQEVSEGSYQQINSHPQIAELRSDLSQVKARLDDITVFLKELRHSAIELTTSVSRRSSMRDKNRRGAAANNPQDDAPEMDAATVRKAFAEQLSNRLSHESRLSSIDESMDQPKNRAPVTEKTVKSPRAKREMKEVSATKRAPEPVAETKPTKAPVAPAVESKGPRFNFNQPAPPPEPARRQIERPKPVESATDDDSSMSDDSSPAVNWLLSGKDTKKSPPIKEEPAIKKPPEPKPQPVAAPPPPPPPRSPEIQSTPESTPEVLPRSKPIAGSGYQALLGAAAPSKKSDQKQNAFGSDSDDLDDQFNLAVQSKRPTTVGFAGLDSLTTDTAKKPAGSSPSDILASLGLTKETPSKSSGLLQASNNQAAKKSASAPALAKKEQPEAAADPDDLLKKLFPDKFNASRGPTAEKIIKKKALFIGDDSGSDIDLPQGDQKSDLDDDFFFR